MKKALAILLALSMVFAAFADEPATNYSVAEFSGSASLEWVSDLDAKTNGFKNDASATLKINLLNGGEKVTAGDGVWGELKIAIETPDAQENPGALEIKKTASVSTAKIHFVDGDVDVALDMLKPNLKIDGDDGEEYDVTNGLKAGFGINVKTSPVALNVYVMDNGFEAEDKEFGVKADASLSIIDNLSLSGAIANNFKTEEFVAKASAGYTYAINDTLSLKPAVDFKLAKDETKTLSGNVLFGWGGEVKFDDDFNGTAGVKVAYTTKLNDSADDLAVEVFDNTLLEGLMLGAKYNAKVDAIAEGSAEARAKYTTAIDIIDAEVSGGVKVDLGKDDVVTGYNYGVKVSTDDVIDNTSLYANYEGGKDNKKGKITVGTKISL